MTDMRGADIVAEMLARQGIEYVAGIPGHTVLDLVDALHERSSRLKAVMVRNEEAAGYLADAYFRLRNRPMAIFAHNSVGAANILTGVMNARIDSSAMIVISGNIWGQNQGRGAFQELIGDRDAGTPDIFRGSVKRAWQITDPAKLPEAMMQAYRTAVTGRPGPVLVDISQDAFSRRVDVELPDDISRYLPAGRLRADGEVVERAARLLAQAERPAILAGGGAVRAGAGQDLLALARELGAPIATTGAAKGVVPEDDPLVLGVTGWVGTLPATTAMRECDVLLAVGSRFSETDTGGWKPGAIFNIPPTRVIQVDVDPAEIGRNYPVAEGLVADAASALQDLLTAVKASGPGRARTAWTQRLDETRTQWSREVEESVDPAAMPLSPGWLTQALRAAAPADSVVVTDVGNSQKWLLQQFPITGEGRCVSSLGGGSMGFGPCGAVGAALAMPGRKVVAITGDGSMAMSLHILPTVAELGAPVVYVVSNDAAYGSVRRPQDMRFGQGHNHFTVFGHENGKPYDLDFAAVAGALGIPAERIADPAQLPEALKRAFEADGPYLLDIPIEWQTYVPTSGSGGFPLPAAE